jgi:hypothetical protein
LASLPGNTADRILDAARGDLFWNFSEIGDQMKYKRLKLLNLREKPLITKKFLVRSRNRKP